MSHEQPSQCYATNIPVMSYNSLIATIPLTWKVIIRKQGESVAPLEMKYEYLSDFEKVSRIVYDELIRNDNLVNHLIGKWSHLFVMDKEELVQAL